jgi:methylthioribose-1-phosphate isomerase
MRVRGAPLIGATAAYGMALAMKSDDSDRQLEHAAGMLLQTRPTAVNLRWALSRMTAALQPLAQSARAQAAYELARQICDEDVLINQSIGQQG